MFIALCRLWLRGFRGDERGGIAILGAFMLPVGLAASALAIDMGSLYVERRAAQSAADLAAMNAAANIEHAEAAAAATLKVNGIHQTSASASANGLGDGGSDGDENSGASSGSAGNATVTVTKGSYDPSRPLGNRFQPGGQNPNAVEVVLTKPGAIFFSAALGQSPPQIAVRAIAASAGANEAIFSVGSRLLGVRDGLINSLLGALLGGNLNLSVADYNSLINADVTLLNFLNALATELNVVGGTYNDVLAANATVGQVIEAIAAVTEQNGNNAATVALETLLGQSTASSLTIPLTSLVNLGSLGQLAIGQPSPGLDAAFSALEFVNAAAVVANGNRQVAVDLGATIPGLLSVKLDIAIGQRPTMSPWTTVGKPEATLHTTQMRIRLVAQVGGTGLLAGTQVRLPVYIDTAYATARLSDVQCTPGQPAQSTATVAARPGIVQAWVGEVTNVQFSDFTVEPAVTKATLVSLPLVKVRGQAHVAAGNINDTPLEFTQSDIANAVVKSTDTSTIAQSLLSSLLGDLDLELQVLGLALGLGGLLDLVASLLAPVAAPLDLLVHDLLTTLGIHLGEADVRVYGIGCGQSTAYLAG